MISFSQVCSSCWMYISSNLGGACPGCVENEHSGCHEYGTSYGSNSYLTNGENLNYNANRSRRSSYDYDGREIDDTLVHSYSSELRHLDSSPSGNRSGYLSGVKPRSSSFSSLQGLSTNMRGSTRKALQHLRVIQRNLVYVIGLSPTITANEAASPPYFGQYGRIVKVIDIQISRVSRNRDIQKCNFS